jgi:hypothetical protein
MMTLDGLGDYDNEASLYDDTPMVAICDHVDTIMGLVDILSLIGDGDWPKTRGDIHSKIVATAQKIQAIAKGVSP